MKHIDEHTLELFVLGAKEVRSRSRSINNHLARCSGCRETVRRLRALYADIDAELAKNEEVHIDLSRQIVPLSRDLEIWTEPVRSLREIPPSDLAIYSEPGLALLWRKIRSVIKWHPVISSSFGFAFVASIILASIYLFNNTSAPSYYYYNTSQNNLNVYSSHNKLLWTLPVSNVAQAQEFEHAANVAYTTIADLYGMRRDVITSLLVENEKAPAPLSIFDSKGQLVRRFTFPATPVSFKGIRYYDSFGAGNIVQCRTPFGFHDLFVASSVGGSGPSYGRSPSILWRLSSNLSVLGEYWHYGCFKAYTVPEKDRASSLMVLVGTDDMSEDSAGTFTFVAVIDPTKLTGSYESSATPGFGLAKSPTELYYIKLPVTDLQRATGLQTASMMEGVSGDSLFYVGVRSHYDLTPPGSYGFDYVFGVKDMGVRQVKYVAPTEQTYAMLKREGKVRGTFGEEYLEDLKDGVEYWDGKEWEKTPTKIIHSAIGIPAGD